MMPSASLRYPIVVSEKRPSATSEAMLAPLRAEQGMPRRFSMTSAKMWMSAPLTSTPLMSEMALAFGETWPEMSSRTLSRTERLIS